MKKQGRTANTGSKISSKSQPGIDIASETEIHESAAQLCALPGELGVFARAVVDLICWGCSDKSRHQICELRRIHRKVMDGLKEFEVPNEECARMIRVELLRAAKSIDVYLLCPWFLNVLKGRPVSGSELVDFVNRYTRWADELKWPRFRLSADLYKQGAKKWTPKKRRFMAEIFFQMAMELDIARAAVFCPKVDSFTLGACCRFNRAWSN